MTAVAKTARRAQADTAYADDFYTGTQEQAARLRAGDLNGLDLETRAEEIESSGRRDFNSLANAWRVILPHMLKFDHRPERRTRSWAISIANRREAAADELGDGPGLKSRQTKAVERAYRRARLEAADETGLPPRTFPEAGPDTRDEMLTRPFAIDPDDTTA